MNLQPVSKISMSLAPRRAVERDTPLMRVMGVAHEGTQEISSLGAFVRLHGQFLAQVVDPETGELKSYASREAILPGPATDWLLGYMERIVGERPSDPTSTLTGTSFRPAGELSDVRFVVDVGLKPANPNKPSERGYEYSTRVAYADPRINPMEQLLKQLGAFGSEALASMRLLETEPAGAAIPGPTVASEAEAAAEPEKGKRRAA